ncbi:MAG: hypothetical protein WAO08_36130 [Hyphomicrobiaceae bacterium]
MTLRKTSIALGLAVVALATASLADTSSARGFRGGGNYYGYFDGFDLYRAPQPSQTLTGATSQSPSRDTRGMPYQGGRGMRDGGRRNGGMGRR